VVRGAERLRSWPRKRGKAIHPTNKRWVDWFRNVQYWTKYLDAKCYADFEEATRGTPLLPRDLMTMQARGRFVMFFTPEGRKIVTVAVRQDVSDSLDCITDAPLMMLLRGPDGWEAIPLSDLINATFQRSGLDELPDMNIRSLSNTMSTNAVRVVQRCCNADAEIHAIAMLCRTGSATGDFRPVVYACDDQGNLGALLATGPVVTGLATGRLQMPLDAPLAVTKGTFYGLGFLKFGGTNINTPITQTHATGVVAVANNTAPANPVWTYVNNNWAAIWAITATE